jgi:hypothetical protein
MKAKSRLRVEYLQTPRPPVTPPLTSTATQAVRHSAPPISRQFSTRAPRVTVDQLKKWLLPFIPFLPYLTLAGLAAATTGYILTTYQPSQLQNWLFPNSYLPLQMAVFLTGWGAATFLLRQPRRGLLVAGAITTLLFFKLQLFEVDWRLASAVILVFFGLFVTIELCAHLFQTTHHSPRANHRSATRHLAR